MRVVPAENPELFTNAYASAGSSRFMVKGRRLWKFEEIVMFTLKLRGGAVRDPKNNSLVIHRLIPPECRRFQKQFRRSSLTGWARLSFVFPVRLPPGCRRIPGYDHSVPSGRCSTLDIRPSYTKAKGLKSRPSTLETGALSHRFRIVA